MKMKFANFISRSDAWVERRYKALYIAAFIIQIVGIVVAYSLYGVVVEGDSTSYMEPAQNFLAHGIMQVGETPILFRTPGYIFILSLIYALTGMSNTAVVAVQALMSIATGFMICRTVLCISKNKKFSVIALFLWTVCIMNYYFVCCILTEISFIFFFVMSLMWGCKFFFEKRFRYVIPCFLCLNCALLIRPTIMYYCIIFAVFLLLAAFLRKIDWKVALMYLCIFVIAFGGWSLRNYKYYGVPLFTSVRYISYYDWYAPETYRIAEKASSEEAYNYFPDQLKEQYPDFDKLTVLEQIYAKTEIGKEYVKNHLGAFVILNLKGLGLEMIGPGKATIDELNLPGSIALLLCALSSGVALFVYLIYAVGFLRVLRRLKMIDWLIFLTNVYLMAGHAVLGYSRFRMSFFATCVIGGMICWRRELLLQKDQYQSIT